MTTSITTIRKLRDALWTDAENETDKRLSDRAHDAATALDYLAGEMVRAGCEVTPPSTLNSQPSTNR